MMDERETQIIERKIKYNEQLVKNADINGLSEEQVEKYKKNIKLYQKQLQED